MRIALPILCVLTPGLLAWVMGRRLIRLRDDATLPERWLRYRTNVVLSSWIPIGALLYAAPAHAVWALPFVLLAAQIGGFPARKVLYEETWSMAEYLGQVLRLLVAWGGFWILLTASPEIVLAAGRYGWLTALALGTMLFAWDARYAEVFSRVAGASPLIRLDLHLRFNGILEKTRLSSSPHVLRFGSPRGRLANAVAIPTLRGSMVLFGETLLEVLEPEEITAIFAHEVAHLEYFDRRRLRWLSVATGIGIALVVLVVPIFQSLFPRYVASAVLSGPLVTGGLLLLSLRGSRAREAASDRRAVALCGDAEALARGLTKLYALARLPRRWPNERLATHPSLARRIQAIRAAGDSSIRSLEVQVIAESRVPGVCVVFENDRASWLEGVPSDAPREPETLLHAADRVRILRYSELQELRVEPQGNDIVKLVARDLQGCRWEVDLASCDAAAVQSTLDSVDARLGRASPVAGKSWSRGVAQNVLAGVQVALLRPLGRPGFQVSTDHVVALTAVNLGLLALGTMAITGDWGVWAFSAAVDSASWVSLLLLVGWVMARMERDRVQPLSFPVIGLSTYAFFLALGILATALGLFASSSHVRGVLWYGSAAWLGLAGLSAVRATLGRWSPRVLGYGGLLVGLVLFAAEHLPSPYWQMASETENASEREEAGPSPAAEDTLYRQPKLLETALGSLKPGRPGVTDLYFVGFGADAGQDVFMKEVETIRGLFDERFDTSGRSLAFVNNAKTLDRLPIATTVNLGEALRRIGRVMDAEEDVLFLYLTGHGSSSRGLSVRFWPLELHELDATRLRTLLDEAGIKWRVIVVSACHSGSLIPALQSDTTFIATAAAADRTSFGCGRADDFTYFGRAFFDEALRRTHSFVHAFERAKAAVSLREEAEKRQPSHPQVFVGAAIRPKLEQLERRLSAGARS